MTSHLPTWLVYAVVFAAAIASAFLLDWLNRDFRQIRAEERRLRDVAHRRLTSEESAWGDVVELHPEAKAFHRPSVADREQRNNG